MSENIVPNAVTEIQPDKINIASQETSCVPTKSVEIVKSEPIADLSENIVPDAVTEIHPNKINIASQETSCGPKKALEIVKSEPIAALSENIVPDAVTKIHPDEINITSQETFCGPMKSVEMAKSEPIADSLENIVTEIQPDEYTNVHEEKKQSSPKTARKFLEEWLFEHSSHPYPSESEKRQLAQNIGFTISKVDNWFINARRRAFKNAPGKFIIHKSRGISSRARHN